MITHGNKNYQKSTRIYRCERCDYTCSAPSNYRKHLQTKKHKSLEMVTDDNDQYQEVSASQGAGGQWVCCCGKSYKHRSGLCRHRKHCSVVANLGAEAAETDSQDAVPSKSDDIRSALNRVVEENRELRELILTQQHQMNEAVTKGTTHNTYNLQLFLTEGCKDAINMSEFIASLPIQMIDLEHTRKHGLHQGIANIMVNGLTQLGAERRPIHCTDVRHETLYIKDNDTWAQGDESKARLHTSLETLAAKQRKAVRDWEESNPEWEKSETKTQEWMHLVKNVMASFDGNRVEEGRLMQVLARETHVPKGRLLTG